MYYKLIVFPLKNLPSRLLISKIRKTTFLTTTTAIPSKCIWRLKEKQIRCPTMLQGKSLPFQLNILNPSPGAQPRKEKKTPKLKQTLSSTHPLCKRARKTGQHHPAAAGWLVIWSLGWHSRPTEMLSMKMNIAQRLQSIRVGLSLYICWMCLLLFMFLFVQFIRKRLYKFSSATNNLVGLLQESCYKICLFASKEIS